ncbi:hypothetical protein A7982_13577 [Minicystis rosea]|nr:hypothetical protein A7982_13577 [Minicystis rosea]
MYQPAAPLEGNDRALREPTSTDRCHRGVLRGGGVLRGAPFGLHSRRRNRSTRPLRWW